MSHMLNANAIFRQLQRDHENNYIRDMNTIGSRIKQVREELGLTQSDLAKRIGAAQSTIGSLESGARNQPRKLISIAAALGVSAEWLETGRGTKEAHPQPLTAGNAHHNLRPVRAWDNEDELPPAEYFFIPAYELKVSCGDGSIAFEVDTRNQPMAMTRAWAKKNGFPVADLFTVQAQGNSMQHRIMDGASVTILKQQESDRIIAGKIYLIVFDGEWYLKYLTPQPTGDIVVRSENSNDYPNWTIPASRAHELTVIGRAVSVSNPLL